MKDVFGREVRPGDKVAVGMSYGQSSVLRVGEVLRIKESEDAYSRKKWSVRVKWTHNGDPHNGRYDVKESTILGQESYTYAKFVILPEGFVEQFPVDTFYDESEA